MEEAEGEDGPLEEPGGGARSEPAGTTFFGPAAVVQGTGNTQINHFGGRPDDSHESWLAEYLVAAADASKEHPYPAVLPGQGPSLDAVYVHQRLGSLTDDGLPMEPEAVERILTSGQTCAVLAGAGGGKSSLLRTLLAIGVDRQLKGAEDGPVPVLVPAAALEGRSLSKALSIAVRLELKGLVRTLPPDLFGVPPRPGSYWLVLVDELDEIADPTRRRNVLRQLLAIERNQKNPQYRFVVATRPLPDGELDLLGPDVPRYELERFQLTELEEVARRWFSAYGLNDPSGQAHLFVTDLDRSRLAGLARIPLMASLLCQLHTATPAKPLPAVRGAIYAEFARLLHKRQYSPAEPGNPREICAGFQRYGEAAVTRAEHTLSHLPDLIEHLAAERRGGSQLGAVEIVAMHPDAEPPPYPVPPDEWQGFLATALRHSGFLTFHAGDHLFAHQTLMEYCAARHTTRGPGEPPLRRILARWRSDDPSYVGFLIDTASPKARRRAMPKLRRLARRGGLDGCLFLAELAGLGTDLPDHVLDATADGLAAAARNRRKAERDRTQAVVALTRLSGPDVQTVLHGLVQSGALNGTALVAAIAELLELGDPQVREMLHDLAVSDAQYSAHRLWAAGHLAAFDDPRLPDVLYVLALSAHADAADRAVAAERLAALHDLRVADAHYAIAAGASADAMYRVSAAMELEALQDHRLPDVLYALARDRRVNFSTRQWAARRVAPGDDPRTAGLLLELARDSALGEDFRRWATWELSALGHPDLPDVLYSLACDPGLDGHARVRAAWDLGRTGDPRARELLRSLALAKPGRAPGTLGDEGSRARAASALAALGSPIAPEVFHNLARDRRRSYLDRRFSVHQLADLGDSHAADALHTLAVDTTLHVSVRTEAAYELADLGDPRGTDVLHSLVLDNSLERQVRAFALLRLSEHTDARVPGILRDLATRESLYSPLRSRAIAGLAKRHEDSVPDMLFTVAADTDVDESARSLAAQALMDRGDARAPDQLHALAAASALRPATREAAITWLGRTRRPRAHALLCDLASSSDLDSGLRYSAVRALALRDAPEAPELFIALALDADARPRDRAAAAYNLTDRGDPRGPDLLCRLARDTALDDEYRFEAAQDLAHLRDPRGPDLLHELACDTGVGSFTRRSAARELARHEDPRLPALLRIMADDPTLDGLSRFVAVRRLTRSGDPSGPELLRRLADDPGLDAEVRHEAAQELSSHTSPADPRDRHVLPHRPQEKER